MNRRRFITSVSRIAIGSTVAAPFAQVLAACTSIPEVTLTPREGLLDVPRSAFLVDGTQLQLVIARVSGVRFPIAVVAMPSQEPYALLMKCTHKDCPVQADVNGFECNCHGSTFDMKGAVTMGPAKESLLLLPVLETTDAYRVDLKGLQ